MSPTVPAPHKALVMTACPGDLSAVCVKGDRDINACMHTQGSASKYVSLDCLFGGRLHCSLSP